MGSSARCAVGIAAALLVTAACGDVGPDTSPRASATSSIARDDTTSTTIGSEPPVTLTMPAAPTTTPSARMPAGDDTTVERVVDGDTIVVAGGERVRLIGIDTPETVDPRTTVQCFGREASRRAGELMPPGAPVRLVYDVERLDRFGRTLAYVYRLADASFVNATLVREGFAFAFTVPPNVAHADDFVRWQAEARDAGRGLWSACPLGAASDTTAATSGGGCDPSYPDTCIAPPPPDLDCGDVPARRFRVLPPDPHRFDGDHDGLGCE